MLRDDLTAALKARDHLTVATLRSAIAAIEDAEAVHVSAVEPTLASSKHVVGATAGVGSSDVARRALTEADEIAIVRGQVEEREAAAEEYQRLGQIDRAERLRVEATVLRRYLRSNGGGADGCATPAYRSATGPAPTEKPGTP